MIKMNKSQIHSLAQSLYRELNIEIEERREEYLRTYDASIHLEETKELLKRRENLKIELDELNTKLSTTLGFNITRGSNNVLIDESDLLSYIKSGASKQKYPNIPWTSTLEDEINILSIDRVSAEDIKEVIKEKYLRVND